MKWIDESQTEESFGEDSPILFSLNDIFLGTGPTNRIGRQVRITSVNVHAMVRHNADPSDIFLDGVVNIPPGWIRMIIFLDKQPTDTDPTLIAASGSANALIETNWLGQLNLNARSRFFVISDKFKNLGRFYSRPDPPDPLDPDVRPSPTVAWDEPQSVMFKEFKKLDIISTYGDSLTKPVTNRLFIAFISNLPDVGELGSMFNPLEITYDVRIRFTDI